VPEVCRQVLSEERPDDDVDAMTRTHGGGRRRRWLVGSEGRHPSPIVPSPARTAPCLISRPKIGGGSSFDGEDREEVRVDGGGGCGCDDCATTATALSSLPLFSST
jgi:hypothetical protein